MSVTIPCERTRSKPMNDRMLILNHAANPQADTIANSSKEGSNSKHAPTSALPELVPGTVFSEDSDPEKTWSNIWESVKASLFHLGHRGPTRVRGIDKMRGASGRMQRMELICRCAGKSTSTARVADPAKQRATKSSRCRCKFKVKVSWNKNTPPTMGKVELTHSEGCMAEAMACSKDQAVSLKTLEENFEKDIRQWTSAGLQLVDMYELISVRLAPLYLGQTGRRKVRIMSARIKREQGSAPTADLSSSQAFSEQLINSFASQNAADGHKREVRTTSRQDSSAGKGQGGGEGIGDTAPQDDAGHRRRRSELLLTRNILLANMVESATETANHLAESYDGKPGSYERCMELFERLRREAFALSGGANPSSVLVAGTGDHDQPTAISEMRGPERSLENSCYGTGVGSSGGKRKVAWGGSDDVRVESALRVHRVRV